MILIRKKQWQVFQDMTMFQQQILCHKLPHSFNNIKMPNNDKESQLNVRHKMIQDFKTSNA